MTEILKTPYSIPVSELATRASSTGGLCALLRSEQPILEEARAGMCLWFSRGTEGRTGIETHGICTEGYIVAVVKGPEGNHAAVTPLDKVKIGIIQNETLTYTVDLDKRNGFVNKSPEEIAEALIAEVKINPSLAETKTLVPF